MSNEFVDKIRGAVNSLDLNDESSWTKAGQPSVERVRDLAGDPTVLRADIEAACPGVTRETFFTAANDKILEDAKERLDQENGTEEQPKPQAATSETGDEGSQSNEDAASEIPAPEPEADQADVEKINEDSEAVQEFDDVMSNSVFLVRGLLMAIIMRLPNPMRVMADKAMLDDMAAFVTAYTMHEERMVAVEMIKSIAETRQTEIPNKQYQGRVKAAMDVVRGELDHIRTGVAPADDRNAAHARLIALTGQTPGPVPGAAIPSALEGDDDQKEAHKRLYGGAE